MTSTVQVGDWGVPERHMACQGHITGEEEEPGLKAAVSSAGVLAAPWPPQGCGVGCVGVTVHGHGMGGSVSTQQLRGALGELCVRKKSG